MKYRILEGREKIDIQDIIRLLKTTYWAAGRSNEQIEKSVLNSSCYGVYLEDERKLVGFGRVISDYATTYYLCDEEQVLEAGLERYTDYEKRVRYRVIPFVW